MARSTTTTTDTGITSTDTSTNTIVDGTQTPDITGTTSEGTVAAVEPVVITDLIPEVIVDPTPTHLFVENGELIEETTLELDPVEYYVAGYAGDVKVFRKKAL